MVRVSRSMLLAFVWITLVAAAPTPESQPVLWSARPDPAAFEKIESDHLAGARRSIDTLLAVVGPRTIENTLAPFDEVVRQINTAAYFAGLMQHVHPEAAFRDKATEMYGKATAAQVALSLNPDVYGALAGLDLSKADAPTRHYVTRQLLLFRLAGVDKDEATRARLKKLNDELTEQQSAFDRNISDDQKTIEVANPSELAGLPEDYIASHKLGANGKIQITTNYPDLFPVLDFAQSDDLRRRMLVAFRTRAYPKNEAVLRKMMALRHEIATTLGYPSWADYYAADKMIASGANVAGFIQRLGNATKTPARREFDMLLAEKRKTHPGASDIWDHESSYYKELLRRAQYSFDSQSLRPYLPYAQVKQGILDTAAKFFHVSFKQERDAPAWDPSVETWAAFDDGRMIGRFYLDMAPRTGKFSHAEMVPVLDGIRGRQLPEAVLVCNFPAPTPTDPGLMSLGDVETFFHEFGHLMHWILAGRQRWAGIGGLTMEADFVEAPSMMLEELVRSPQVLGSFANHWQTQAPLPADRIAAANRASAFGRASYVALQMSFSAISYDIYKGEPAQIDLDAVTDRATREHVLYKTSPGMHPWASFGHLGGYSSAYYTYMWDLEIAQDFWSQFDPGDPLKGDAPMRYRRLVLEPGGSMSANDLVKNFLGRPQGMTALLRWMGKEFEESARAQAQ